MSTLGRVMSAINWLSNQFLSWNWHSPAIGLRLYLLQLMLLDHLAPSRSLLVAGRSLLATDRVELGDQRRITLLASGH